MAGENERVIHRYLKSKGIWAEKSRLKANLRSHQDYPSIFSISETLKEIRVDSMIVKLTIEDFKDVDFPIIAHLVGELGTFVLLTKKEKDTIHYFDGNKVLKETVDDFQKKWTGVTLLLSNNEDSGLEKNIKNFITAKSQGILKTLFSLIVGIGILSSLLLSFEYSVSKLIPLIITLIGSLITYSMIKVEQGESNSLSERLCLKNKKMDCHKVLRSSDTGLFGIFKWSQLGLLFFTGQFLFILFSIINHLTNISFVLLVINALALPFIIYNIYVQMRVLKKWCTLCLLSHALVLINLGYISSLIFQFTFEPTSLNTLALCFLIVATFQVTHNSMQSRLKTAVSDKRSLNKLKYDKKLFRSALLASKSVPDIPIHLPTHIGNPAGENEITIVTNQFCDPCAKMHKKLEHLNEQLSGGLRMKLIMLQPPESEKEPSKLSRHAYELSLSLSGKEFSEALGNWFALNDKMTSIDRWINEHPIKQKPETTITELKMKSEREWIEKSGITATPTIFLNGHQLPDMYSVNDLKNLLQ